MRTVSALCFLSGIGIAAHQILAVRHGLDVTRPNTVAHTAEVIWLKPLRDRPTLLFVGPPMGFGCLAGNAEFAIAICEATSSP
jgi:hypothetical protein